ncbi:MAG: class I SAM-dependent methyltransferase [Pseudomonadota bacterium]
MGLSTVLGLKPQGFFIPYRHADGLDGPIPTYQPFEAMFATAEPVFTAVLNLIDDFSEELLNFGGEPPEPRWDQGWFSRLDGAAAYVMVRQCQPHRIVEVGSGHSTRFMVRALFDGQIGCAFTAIDPAPRADIARLSLNHVPSLVQEAPIEPFAELEPGDILFVDSSHLAQPGTDVDWLVTRILPCLPEGVLVHFHDICLPDDYFDEWAWRGYNEQQVVAALLAGGGFRPLFASHYVATRMAETVAAGAAGRIPIIEGGREASLWLEKTGPAVADWTAV